ncbi:hypothetical protein BDR07DRAFT_1496411 [Suillus spraguei]|nr:hypothetical protein BDR07DRAFT_1496411 [Suillus spraguei]
MASVPGVFTMWMVTFRYRRFIFISEVPRPTEITLFLTMEPHFPDSTNQPQPVPILEVFKIGPSKRQETIDLPSVVNLPCVCTLDDTQGIFSPNVTSLEAASDLIWAEEEGAYKWVPNGRTGICVANRAPHEVSIALATPFNESASPFWKFDLLQNMPRNFTSRIFVHAFETTDAKPGSQDVFSDPGFLANRITKEGGLRCVKTCPKTYWYISWHGDDGLKVEISNSRKAKYKRRKYNIDVTSNS